MTSINNLAWYGPMAMRTEKPMPTNQRKMHALLGMLTENGEFTTGVKRVVIYKKAMTAEMVNNMLEELGDWCWYAAIALDTFGVEFSRDETFLPIHWNRKTVEDKLVYCSVFLGSVSSFFHAGMELSLLNKHDEEQTERQISSLRAAVTVIDMTIESLTEGRASILDVLGANIEKLRARFPDAYSNEAAEARADKGGLSALES